MSMLTRKGTMVRKGRGTIKKSGSTKSAPGRTRGQTDDYDTSSVSSTPVASTTGTPVRETCYKPSPARSVASTANTVVSYDDGKQLYQTSVRWTSQISSVEPQNRGEVYLQIQEVNKDADDTLDFVCRASDVLCNTICITILIGISMAVPVGMVSCGIKYLNECPKQPKIPVYLLVGGCLGTIKIIGMLWRNIQIRRYESMDAFFDAHDNDTASGTRTYKFMDGVLSTFLFGWQITGSYWVFSIWEPHYKQLLHEPSNWCDQTVYMFSVIQILGCYAVMCLGFVVLCCLAGCYKYTSVFDT